MGARVRRRRALAAVLGAVAVGAAAVGGAQALGDASAPAGPGPPVPVGTAGPGLPGASDPDAIAPPAGAVARPPGFAPSAVVPLPLPAPRPEPVERPRPASSPEVPSGGSATTARSPGPATGQPRPPTSGESQYEYGCRRGYITEGC